jgi:hypothetical protein
MVERRFDDDGSSSADELEGMWTDRGCGAALYDPGAESGNTRVTRARSYQGQRPKLHQGELTLSTAASGQESSTLHFHWLSGPAKSLLLPARRELKSTRPIELPPLSKRLLSRRPR